MQLPRATAVIFYRMAHCYAQKTPELFRGLSVLKHVSADISSYPIQTLSFHALRLLKALPESKPGYALKSPLLSVPESHRISFRSRTVPPVGNCTPPLRNHIYIIPNHLPCQAVSGSEFSCCHQIGSPDFMVRAILFFLTSTLSTRTSTISPTLTTSEGWRIYLSDKRERCTSPS